MNVEGLACYVIGARQVCVPVIFTDEHPQCTDDLPVALVRGCIVARNHAELSRLALRVGEVGDAVGVRLYVEPDTIDAEVCSLWLAGFRVRVVQLSEVIAEPGWWHLAAHRHHAAETRGLRCPPSADRPAGQTTHAPEKPPL
jgi:hypothetical protein